MAVAKLHAARGETDRARAIVDELVVTSRKVLGSGARITKDIEAVRAELLAE